MYIINFFFIIFTLLIFDLALINLINNLSYIII